TAILFTSLVPAGYGAAALAAAYASAYACGALVSWLVLRRALGTLDGHRMLRFALRALLVSLLSAVTSWMLWWLLNGSEPDPEPALSFVRGAAVGVVHLTVFLGLARLFRIRELSELVQPLVASVRRRLPGG